MGPGPLGAVLRRVWPDRISWEELVSEMDRAIQIPGTRTLDHADQGAHRHALDGIRTPVGIKIFGADSR